MFLLVIETQEDYDLMVAIEHTLSKSAVHVLHAANKHNLPYVLRLGDEEDIRYCYYNSVSMHQPIQHMLMAYPNDYIYYVSVIRKQYDDTSN